MPKVADLKISDDELRESIEANQLRLMKERGNDLTLFSARARASWPTTSATSTCRAPGPRSATSCASASASSSPTTSCRRRCCRSRPGVDPKTCIPELEKCVERVRLRRHQPQPRSVRRPLDEPPLTDRHWYPIYEKMVEYDIPAMVHVCTSCNPCFHTTGAHYLNADTTAFMQLHPGRPVQGLPDAALHHPARRRRGALPLGPLSAAWRRR